MLGGIGKDTVAEALKGADALQDELRDQTIPAAEAALQSVVNNLAGQIQMAAGAVALAAGALPDSIVSALDGLTVEVSAIKVTIRRKVDG